MSNWDKDGFYTWPEGSPKVGDIVQHTSKFLRNCAWYTNVPTDGKVIAVGKGLDHVEVLWCDARSSAPIHKTNIKPSGAWEPN